MKLITKRFEYYKRIYTSYQQLLSQQWWNSDQLESYQLTLLKQRLADAKKVPLYQNKHLPDPQDIKDFSDWRQLPLLSKSELTSSPSHNYYLNQDYKIETLKKSQSSGSKKSFYLKFFIIIKT